MLSQITVTGMPFCLQLVRRDPAALEQRAGLVGEDVEPHALLRADVDRREGRAVLHGRQAAGVAVGEDVQHRSSARQLSAAASTRARRWRGRRRCPPRASRGIPEGCDRATCQPARRSAPRTGSLRWVGSWRQRAQSLPQVIAEVVAVPDAKICPERGRDADRCAPRTTNRLIASCICSGVVISTCVISHGRRVWSISRRASPVHSSVLSMQFTSADQVW